MKRLSLVLGLAILFSISAVQIYSAGQKEEEGGLTFAFVCRSLTHPFYIDVERGIKSGCEKLGINYLGFDADLGNEAFIKAVDTAIERGIDGLIVVVTDQSLGPIVYDKCRDVGIPFISIDIPVKDSGGKQIPYVGAPYSETGEIAGNVLSKLASDRGFFKTGNQVKVLQIDVSSLSFMAEISTGYEKALMQNLPLKKDDFIRREAENGVFEECLQIATSTIDANTRVTHWIITGLNEEGAIAPLRVLENRGFSLDRVIACGIGGSSLSYEEFQKPHKSYITIKLDAFKEGETAVQILYNYVIEGTRMPQSTFIPGIVVTEENYKEF
ncbi:MAG: substrate-binding domain-containing protein, partial [Spirochaetota bacterium]